MDEIIDRINKFNEDRDWNQFHSPENLSKSIIIEAAELLEHFQWDNDFNLKGVTEELADILLYCMQLAIRLDLDIKEIIMDKIEINEKKYPIEKAKSNSKKYTEFESNHEN